MAINHNTNPRTRPAPHSNLPRNSAFGRVIAARHDGWLRRRAARSWARELDSLDERTLRDIGLSRAAADDLARDLRIKDRTRAEITFPPHCFPGLVKLDSDLEG